MKTPKGKSESINRQHNGHKKVKKDKQRSAKHIQKTKDRVTRTELKTGGELRCSGRECSSCSTSVIVRRSSRTTCRSPERTTPSSNCSAKISIRGKGAAKAATGSTTSTYSANSGVLGYSASPIRRRNKYMRDNKCSADALPVIVPP